MVSYPVETAIHLLSDRALMDSAIHRISHYPTDEYQGNKLRYPVDGDLSGE